MSDKSALNAEHGYKQSNPDGKRLGILLAIHDQREKQEAKYPGTTCASADHSWTDRMAILGAEYGEAIEEAKMLRWPWTRKPREGVDLLDCEVRERLRLELTQMGAVVVACIEAVDAEDEAAYDGE